MSLPDDDTRLQTHHEEDEEEDEEQQQEGRGRRRRPGEHRAGPAGGATARHGTARVSGQPTGPGQANETRGFYFSARLPVLLFK